MKIEIKKSTAEHKPIAVLTDRGNLYFSSNSDLRPFLRSETGYVDWNALTLADVIKDGGTPIYPGDQITITF